MAYNIIDKGWLNMEALLNKELPVKQKKNKLILWFLLGLGLIITVALFQVFNLTNSQNIIDDSVSVPLLANNEIEAVLLKDENKSQIGSILNEGQKQKETITQRNPTSESLRSPQTGNVTETVINSIKETSTKTSVDNNISTNKSNNSKNVIVETQKSSTNTTDVKSSSGLALIIKNIESSPSPSSSQKLITTNIKENVAGEKGLSSDGNQKIKKNEIRKVPLLDLASMTFDLASLYSIDNDKFTFIKPLASRTHNEVYLNVKAYPIHVPQNFEIGYNHHIYNKKIFSLYSSIGLSSTIPTITYVSDQFGLDPIIFGGTSIGADKNDGKLEQEYFNGIGFIQKRVYAAKFGLGIAYVFSKKWTIRNETAMYHYINSNVSNQIPSNQFDASRLTQNKIILSNLTTIGYQLSNRFNIYTGYQFSFVPEYQITIEESVKQSKAKEIVLGTHYTF